MNRQVLEMVLCNRHNIEVQCDLMDKVADDLQKKTYNWVIREICNMLDSGIDPRDCDFESLFFVMKSDVDNG